MKQWIILAVLSLGFAFAAEESVTFDKDVVYGKCANVELKLNLSHPEKGDGPFPCLVFIHGGGWAAGDRKVYDNEIKEFAKHGYVVATVGYRFAPEYHFPAQVEDVKCAVRYLRAHAKELKINPAKFGALGESAGGHLSLMLGLMNKEDGLEGESGSADQSSKVQAVVNYFGPGDFVAQDEYNELGANIVRNFLGTDDPKSPLVAKSSPMTYIDKTDAPVLTFHGTNDFLVPLNMSKRLHEALKKAGVEEKLVVLEGQGHGWGGKTREKTMKESLEFFDKHLKN